MSAKPERRLRVWLVIMLVTTSLATLFIVGSAVLALRVNAILSDEHLSLQREAGDLSGRVEMLLGALQSRVETFGEAVRILPPERLAAQMDVVVGKGDALRALYLIDERGIVRVASVGKRRKQETGALLGSDFVLNPLYRQVRASSRPVWSDRYQSSLSGEVTVGLGIPLDDGKTVIAEVDLEYLLRTTRQAQVQPDVSVWVLDTRGEVVVDTSGELRAGVDNIGHLDGVRQLLAGQEAAEVLRYGNVRYAVDAARSSVLGWLFVVKRPTGLANPRIRGALIDMALLFGGGIVIGLALAPLWSRDLSRSVGELAERARQVASGMTPGVWPRGKVTEFNQLAGNLERMAQALTERERKFLAIFNASPIAMMVVTDEENPALVEINDAWVKQFGHARHTVVGRRLSDLRLCATDEAHQLLAQAAGQDHAADAVLRRADGGTLVCSVGIRVAFFSEQTLRIVVLEDVTLRRAMERDLIEMARGLEQRVAQRTEALESANAELSHTLDTLREAQGELVRTEKLASLGELVAGIAHELNTPLGNGLMAISTLSGQVTEFRHKMLVGLKRSALEEFVDNVTAAAEMATRNVHRAADLVASFKQVAVDQASSQRRAFDLHDMVDEVLLTLLPTLRRTPYQVHNRVASGIMLDNFPGPLGQILTNLVNNAVMHGFDGRDHGEITLFASSEKMAGQDWIVLTVHDDGRGIPDDIVARVFDPFVTTRKGRGGTGLGLHIVHNMTTQLLGGVISLDSWPGVGTSFVLHFPARAPDVEQAA